VRHALLSPAYFFSVAAVAALVVIVFVIARSSSTESRKIAGGAYRPLLTTALTLLGLLLPSSAAALLYVIHLGRVADSGFLLAALTLYPVILLFAVWALAGSMRYAGADDKLEFTADVAWAYVGAYAAIYVLLISAVVLTAMFFVFRSDILVSTPTPSVSRTTVTLSRSPIRVGDSRATVLELWGKPESLSVNPSRLYYSRGDTVISVLIDAGDTVREVLVGTGEGGKR
jgi:hypothetical protein